MPRGVGGRACPAYLASAVGAAETEGTLSEDRMAVPMSLPCPKWRVVGKARVCCEKLTAARCHQMMYMFAFLPIARLYSAESSTQLFIARFVYTAVGREVALRLFARLIHHVSLPK